MSDIPAFAALGPNDVGVVVGHEPPTAATYAVTDPVAVTVMLEAILERLRDTGPDRSGHGRCSQPWT